MAFAGEGKALSRIGAASGFVAAALCLAWAAPASAQEAGAAQQEAGAAQQETGAAQDDGGGDDYVKPPANLFQLTQRYRTAPGRGAAPGSITDVTTQNLIFRLDHRIDLAPQWKLALRSDLPLAARNPNGDYVYGLGDADVQAALIHDLGERWTVGGGARLIAPTGAPDITSGKWRIMPGAAVRYALPEISSGSFIEPLVRYDVSFAGDPSRRNIGNLQIAPTVNFALPDRWFFRLYPSPDIRVNFSDPVVGQTGRLFLPFNARVGRRLSDDLVVSLEIGVPIIDDYPVYKFKSEVRVNLTF
jgi:hypothetical protein